MPLQAGRDIFSAMAARLFGLEAEAAVKDAQRAQAKAVSYAILYGAGPGLLVQSLAVSLDAAKRLIAAWHRAYPRVQELVEERLHAARLVGFVETLGGRKRFLPHIKASGRAERARAERQVVNTLCQGSAADLIKRAMLAIDAELVPAEGGSTLHRAETGRLLL